MDTYLINGVDLRTEAWRISAAEGLQDAPDLRGEDVVVPGAHGTLDLHANPVMPRRRYSEGRIRFEMWVKGVHPVTGVGPASEDDLSVYLARLDELQRLFNARQLVIEHPRPDGTRRAVARLASPIRPTREPSSPWFGRFVADCVIPGAFWTDLTDTTVSASVTSGGFIDLSALACAAPITDAELRFGPGNNPMLLQDGTYFQWSGVIAAGRELLVKTATWEVMAGAGTAWTPANTAVTYGPGPSWLELDPTATPFRVALIHTGGGSMSCSITARRKHLTS